MQLFLQQFDQTMLSSTVSPWNPCLSLAKSTRSCCFVGNIEVSPRDQLSFRLLHQMELFSAHPATVRLAHKLC